MRNVYAVADNIFSPLGENTNRNMEALWSGRTGIRQHHGGLDTDFFYASLFPESVKKPDNELTVFEQIVFHSAQDAMLQAGLDPADDKTGFILSSTKGNIGLIEGYTAENFSEQRLSLNTSAELITS